MLRKIIFFIVCLFLTPSCFAEVFITSVFPNTSDDANLEYIELYNSSGSSLDISGYSLSDLTGKSYIFGSGILLESKVFTQYLRTETKIILNNTNEEIFLKNPLGEVIDSISYTTSVKGEKITFLEKIVNQEDVFTQEVFISGEALISDEVPISSGENTLPTEIFIPEVQWSFQQPSYILDKTLGLSEYICNPEKDECRINFDFRPSFSEVGESGYECEIDFGFTTNEDQKCNPNTVTFPKGEFEVIVRIISQADRSISQEKKLIIYNTRVIQTDDTPSQEDTQTETDISLGAITLQTLVFELQSPSYIFPRGESTFFCDRERDTCKVNFDLRSSFGTDFPESKYDCRFDFGFITGEEQKCNPNTIEVPLGRHIFRFQIYEKATGILAAEKTLELENLGKYKESEKPLSVSRSYRASDFIDIQKPEISIQSGLLQRDGKYYCTKERCLVNLEYIKQDPDLKCLWNFSEGIYKESSLTRCNPGIIEYSGGIHRITLKVYQANNQTNYFESRLVFENFPEEIQDEEREDMSEEETISEAFGNIDLKIVLQGKVGKNKILGEKNLKCFTKTTCSINFTSQMSFSGAIQKTGLQYFWDFGNGDTYIGENPKALHFSFGEYEVQLSVKYGEKIIATESFGVNVIQEEMLKRVQNDEKTKTQRKEKIFSGSLSFVSVLANPAGNDIREWIEVENTGLTDIELSLCYLRNGSKKSKFPAGIFYPFESQKIFRVFSNFSLGNSKDEIELWCGDTLQDTFVWDHKIPEGNILFSDGTQTFSNYDFTRKDFKNEQDYRDFIEKTWKVNVRKLKSGVKISGETLAHIPVKIISSQGKEFLVETDRDGLFEILLDTKISLGELSFDFEFQDDAKNTFFFDDETVLFISAGDRNNFLSKYVKKVRKKKTSSPTEKGKILAIEQEKKEENILSSLDFLQKILFTFFLSFLVLFCSILLLPKVSRDTHIFELYKKIFEVRQRVNLIL